MEKIAYIPFKNIQKIEIYINSQKLTLSEIVKQTGCDYAITGNYYTSAWKPTCHLKVDGVVKASDQYTYWGYAFNQGPDIISCRVPSEAKNYKNYYACCTLINNGQKSSELHYNSDVGGTRGRTGVGIKGDSLVLYASTDGSNNAKTPENLRDYIYAQNVTSFVMGDGGGKVNMYDGSSGTYMQGSAKSQNLILVYLKHDNGSDKTDAVVIHPNAYTIIASYITNNPRYKANQKKAKIGYMQHSTGTPGGKAKAFINTWNSQSAQAEVEFVIDDTGIYQTLPIGIRCWHCGGSGNNTLVGCEVCEPEEARLLDANWKQIELNGKYNTVFAVKMAQKELAAWGYYSGPVDGKYNIALQSAVKAFQKDNGITVGGAVGKNTLHKLQTRKGSYLLYPKDNKELQSYFEDVYRKAVFTCAYVLKQLGVSKIDKNSVCSHAEGYKMGIASNHADVGHWWPQHGKSMDDFRADVKTYMETGVLPYTDAVQPDPIEDVKTPAEIEMETAWDKACDMGIFDGSNPAGTVSRRVLAVVLDRLNLLKN